MINSYNIDITSSPKEVLEEIIYNTPTKIRNIYPQNTYELDELALKLSPLTLKHITNQNEKLIAISLTNSSSEDELEYVWNYAHIHNLFTSLVYLKCGGNMSNIEDNIISIIEETHPEYLI